MNPEQNQALRHAALEVLATREGIAWPARTIRRRITDDDLVEFKPDEADVARALDFLCGLAEPLIKRLIDPLGSSNCYQATSEGVLHWERSK